ncbi:MAG TPA: VRR-NUC domain-containing protein [Sphingobacteriaceae bacterium]
MSEDQIQAKLFQRVWNELPQTRRLFFSIPNGSSRDVREAVKLKATGLVAGQPDMCLVWNGKVYGFELKTKQGNVSPQQTKVHEAWKNANAPVFIVRDPDEGFELIRTIVCE